MSASPDEPQPQPSSTDEATQPIGTDAAASRLAHVLDHYLAALQAGTGPDRAALLAAHPELAAELEACLAGLEFIHHAAQPGATPAQIGEFRIVREIGRGGMGVVYEAEQISLRRRVALKVLKIGGMGDAEALERFQREAETVAHLHHTNIVPIFAVGCARGVHYFAMQFITGRSLADVLRDGQSDSPRSTQDVARWCLEAAEGLAHAHQRGVIHRDVKPSNLLLDDDGRVWLTDFGLARRSEEATLTVTGALMGTPRYMSPEQAGATLQPVDHRTDIFSLGATLYELATGQPAFDAATPHAILTKIVTREPVSPRKITADVPRDLETIILKCLAKDPRERYATARDLADDLRRFIVGDPIRARRPSLWEQMRRWTRKRRRSVAASVIAAGLAALVAIGAVVAWQRHDDARKGKLSFHTTGPHFKAELFDADDRPTGVSFTAPNEEPVRVPPGDYKARLTRDGVLSETVELSVDPSSSQTYEFDLSGRELWPQVDVPNYDAAHDGYAFVNFGEQTDLVLLRTWRGLTRLPGRKYAGTWQDDIRWEVSWQGYHPGSDEHPGAKGFGYTMPILEMLNRERFLAATAPRLNRGNEGDLVWSGGLGVVAIDGANGKVIWHHPWRANGFASTEIRRDDEPSDYADAFGRPLVQKVNDDATPDVIATAELYRIVKVRDADGKEARRNQPYRWVAAIDGTNGSELWRRDDLTATFPNAADAERELSPMRVETGERTILIVKDGARVLLLDPKTGADLWPPLVLGDVEPTQFETLDLSQDGKIDTLFWVAGERIGTFDLTRGESKWPVRTLDFAPVGEVRIVPGTPPTFLAFKETARAEHELRAYRPGDDGPIWTQPLRVMWPKKNPNGWSDVPLQTPIWPVVADRLQEGSSRDVIVPNRFSRTKPEPETESGTIYLDFDDTSQWWAGLSVFDAESGALRWQRQFPADAIGDYLQLDFIAAGPDIDGDGFREVFVAAFGSATREAEGYGNHTHRRMYVTCLAGNDGRELWWWRERFTFDSGATIRPLKWWQLGPDGHPLLMVSYDADASHSSPKSPSATYFLQASTGTLEHVLTGVGQPTLADIDGDGLLDLHALVRPDLTSKQFRSDVNPRLFTMKGTLPVAWKRLGQWKPATDVDGDGVEDAIQFNDDTDRISTVDGRTGRPLWSIAGEGDFQRLPADRGDLDGDGVIDMVTRGGMKRGAISMKTGRLLWRDLEDIKTPEAVGTREGGRHFQGPTLLRPFGDARTVVVYDFWLSFGPTTSAERDQQVTQLWIAGIDGATGAVLWRTPLGSPGKDEYDLLHERRTADLDGDGTEDLVLLCVGTKRWIVRGVRGRDGTLLWERELAQPTAPITDLQDIAPVLLIDERVGEPPRILIVERDAPIASVETQGHETKVAFGESAHRILSLDPRDGTPRTLWRGPTTPADETKSAQISWGAIAVLARFDETGRSLCALLARPRSTQGKFHEVFLDRIVLSPAGEVVHVEAEEPTTVAWSSTMVMPDLQAADVDGDGFDEIVWGTELDDGDYILASRGGFDRTSPLWKRYESSHNVGEIISMGDGRPALVTVHDGRSGVYALDGRTGRIAHKNWQGELLRSSRPDDPLRFLHRNEDLTTCSITGPQSDATNSTSLAEPPPDPRLSIGLPWSNWSEVTAALECSLYSLGLVVLPLWLIGRLFGGRRWLWGGLLLAWVGGVWFAYHRGWLPGSLDLFGDFMWIIGAASMLQVPLTPLSWIGVTLDLAWLRAILGLPVLGIALGLFIAIRRWRWRGAIGFLTLAAIAAVIEAVIVLRIHPRFDPHQYYTFDDGWLILLHGAYYAGLVALIVWLTIRIGKGVRHAATGMRRRWGLGRETVATGALPL